MELAHLERLRVSGRPKRGVRTESREPLRSIFRREAIRLAGVTTIAQEFSMHTKIPKSLGRSDLALRDLLAIGALNTSKNARIALAKGHIARYQADAEEYHLAMDGVCSDLLFLVQMDVARLRDAVDAEIAHRAQRKMDDEPTRFLETITDYLHGHRVTLRAVAA